MQSVKVLVVLLALSQVECAPSSIWPAHRFSPPATWPFKQPSAPSSLFFSTHFPGSTAAPSDVSLPAEVVVGEPVVDIGNPVIAEVIPVGSALLVEVVVVPGDSALPAEVIVIPEEFAIPPEVVIISEEPALPAETIIPDVLKVESVPQLQEPVISTSENVILVQEVTAAPVTDIPVEASKTTTIVLPSFQDSDTFKAYEQFINTWLTTASITLNRPDLLSLLKNTRPKTISTGKFPVSQSVEKSVEKSVENVVEDVTISESSEPKKVSGPLKKTPATVVLMSTTQSPIIVDIPVTEAKPVTTNKPIPSTEVVVPSEPQEATIIASELIPESIIVETVAAPELIVFEPIPENSPVQEQVITEVFESIPETPLIQEKVITEVFESIPERHLVQDQIITEVELIEVPSSLQPAAAPELIALETVTENLPIQGHTITEVDLLAEPSILQPVVVSQPAVQEFALAAEPQLTESSYSKLAVSADGTIMVAPNPPASSNVAQPSLVEVAPEPAQPRVIETFTPEGLTYTLQLFPKQGSSFFYSHTLGG